MKTKEEKLELKEHKREKKRFFKWLKKKRKVYLKFFKSWAPWDSYYIYTPIKMMLQDFYEYYKNGDWVMGIPITTDENGNCIQKDDRLDTLKTVLDLIQKTEDLEDKSDTTLNINEANAIWEESRKTLIKAFSSLAEYMDSWWD